MSSWTVQNFRSLGEAADLASSIVNVSTRPAEAVYLLLSDCTLETLERIASFSTLPNYKAQGRVRSYERLEQTLKVSPPLELMLSLQNVDAGLDELLLLRWPTEKGLGYANLRWNGPELLTTPVKEWLAGLGEGVARSWRRDPVSVNQGHLITHFLSKDPSIARGLISKASEALRACSSHQSRFADATVSWIGTLESVERLVEEGAVGREPSFPGLLGYGPAGEPEDNVDRDRPTELAASLERASFSPAQLWWTGLALDGIDELHFSVVLTRRRSGSRVQVSADSTVPSLLKSKIQRMISTGS